MGLLFIKSEELLSFNNLILLIVKNKSRRGAVVARAAKPRTRTGTCNKWQRQYLDNTIILNSEPSIRIMTKAFMRVDLLYVIIHVVTKQLGGLEHAPAYLWSWALDGMLQRWSTVIKDVLFRSFVFMNGRSQRTWYVCRSWNHSGSLRGKMNRIDQNSVPGKLALKACVLNTHASLIMSVWLMGKLGLDFLLCLLFLERI